MRRLRLSLLVFFLALLIPTTILVWQAYSQLKWETLNLYRGQAEELTARIDASLESDVARAEASGFADYQFLLVSGDGGSVQRSPLAAFPVPPDVPGLIGYFQVDSGGRFSTPLLPSGDIAPGTAGLSPAEYRQRATLAGDMRSVLQNNRLVEDHTGGSPPVAAAPAPGATGAIAEQRMDSQSAFDALQTSRPAMSDAAEDDSLGKVAELKLDTRFQEKAAADTAAGAQVADLEQDSAAPPRAKRREQVVLPESAALAVAPADRETAERRIRTFESEIDPLEFSLLDSGHLVLYRKVWRDGERFVQGMLLDRDTFMRTALARAYRDTALSGMSRLLIAYRGDVLYTATGRGDGGYRTRAGEPDGTLLYRGQLAAPFNGLELIFVVDRLPSGPGAPLLGWLTLVLLLILCGGCFALYRLGFRQILLARQQQDFVSAVSHELKTPLTSIRMYGEMLKEGWAPEAKKQDYYAFIHSESERLTRLIGNVLQLARITRSELQLNPQHIRVAELMQNAQTKIASQVQQAGFELAVSRDPAAESATVDVDEDCFAQIIINLVDNAIKFSRNAALQRIELRTARETGGRVVVSVRDYGPGVPGEQMRKIFTLFYRSENELTRETVGTGIGLAIVQQLATAMNGTVDVLNREPGAEFRLRFPVIAGE